MRQWKLSPYDIIREEVFRDNSKNGSQLATRELKTSSKTTCMPNLKLK